MTRTDLPLWVAALFVGVTGFTMLAGSVSAAGCSLTGELVDAQGIPAVKLDLAGFLPNEPLTLTTTRPDGTVYTDANVHADPNGNTVVLAGTIIPGTYIYEARGFQCVATASFSVGAAASDSPVAPTPVPTLPATDTE